MQADAQAGRYRFTLAGLSGRFEYFVQLPGAESPVYTGSPIETLTPTALRIEVHPPPYARIAPVAVQPDAAEIAVVAGGRVGFGVEPPEPARRVVWQFQALTRGGFLLLDDCTGTEGRGFDQSARALAARMFPDAPLERLPMTHPLFHCFFDIEKVEGGDKLIHPWLEGVTREDRTPLVLCSNDLGCAWEGHACSPGGEAQRAHAFQLGINLIFYALTF